MNNQENWLDILFRPKFPPFDPSTSFDLSNLKNGPIKYFLTDLKSIVVTTEISYNLSLNQTTFVKVRNKYEQIFGEKNAISLKSLTHCISSSRIASRLCYSLISCRREHGLRTKAKSLILCGPNSNSNPNSKKIFGIWIYTLSFFVEILVE